MLISLVIILLAIVLSCIAILVWMRDPESTLRFRPEDLRSKPLLIPPGFLWGSATSAHQVEGGCTNNNWSVFESTASVDGRYPIAGNQRTGAAADHWNRYPDDIQLMKDLCLNAYRFSVEWSKIEPSDGHFDALVLDHYVDLVNNLRANGIEPMLTLHHFTNPVWFEQRGAFLQNDSPEIFARFVRAVSDRLGTSVKFWVTVNEPSVEAFNGYLFGEFPPGERNARRALRALRNLLQAHTAAYRTLKEKFPDVQVGPAINIFPFDPPSQCNVYDVAASRWLNYNANESFLRFLRNGVWRFGIPGIASEFLRSESKGDFDFVGLNYYTRFRKRINPFALSLSSDVPPVPPERFTDMGWEIYPEGLYRSLRLVHRFLACPIVITENGIADDIDTKRARFIEDHLLVMNKAIAEGIDVRGYFYWSLLDNLEWSLGYTKRFGLYHVDFATQKRTLRSGSASYPSMIKRFKFRQR